MRKTGSLYDSYRKSMAYGGDLYGEDQVMEVPPIIGGGPRGGKDTTKQGTVLGDAAKSAGKTAGKGTNWGSIAGGVASLGTGLIDSVVQGDPLTGRKSIGSSIGSGALQGAATGTSILPGWGTLIGAVVGAAAGWIGGGAKRRKARAALANDVNMGKMNAQNYSAAQVAADPSLVEGYRNAGYYGKYGGKITQFAHTGTSVSAPMASMFMNGGRAKSLSSETAELVGRLHSKGGIDIPSMNAELEGGETVKGDYVFSSKLGFASAHKPIARAKGRIEGKPATRERINTLRRLSDRENSMVLAQEFIKNRYNLS